MLQPGMYSETSTTYHFGFNGMMRDDEVKELRTTLPNEVIGNSYDFGCPFSTIISLLRSWGIVVSVWLCFFLPIFHS